MGSTYPQLGGLGHKGQNHQEQGQRRIQMKRSLSAFSGKLHGSYYPKSQQ